MKSIIFFCAVVGCVYGRSYPPMPKWFKTCKRQPQPAINACILEKSLVVLPELLKGVKELRVPDFMPLKLKEVSVLDGGNFNLKLLDIDLWGLDTSKLISVKFDLPGNHLDGRLYFKELQVNATYDIDGRILILPIKGQGPGFVRFYGILIDVKVDWHLRQDGDYHLFEVTNLKVKYTVKSAFVKFDNLFNGDKKMGDEMNLIVNENWNQFHESIRTAIESMIETTALSLIVNVVANVPLEIMFPLE